MDAIVWAVKVLMEVDKKDYYKDRGIVTMAIIIGTNEWCCRSCGFGMMFWLGMKSLSFSMYGRAGQGRAGSGYFGVPSFRWLP